MKYAENLVAKNRSGTEVKFRGLVRVVALVEGVRFNYVVVVGEKKKDKDFIV